MGYRCAIHTNTGLAHQVKIARTLLAGFEVHGIVAVMTDAGAQADMHVCMGPWYALEQWRHANTLYIDRAYWGDPGAVSVHWLRDGEKHFNGFADYRPIPDVMPYRDSQKRIYLCDYDKQPQGDYDAVRHHPAGGNGCSLVESLDGYGVAIGKRTTALIDAAINGLVVITDDPHSPVWPISGRRAARRAWLTGLAWHNWTLDEIKRGDAWEHLKQR